MPGSRVLKLGVMGGLAAVTASLAIALASGASADGTTVGVASGTAQIGYEAAVELTATAIDEAGLGAWTIDVVYNPAIVSVAGCQAKSGGLCNPAYHANTVRVAGISAFGLRGDRILATISFECTNAGDSDLAPALSVFADATPGGPQPIDAKLAYGSIGCTVHTKPTATPTVKPTATPDPSKLAGDANCDHVVDALDAVLVLQYAADLFDSLACELNADFNHNGDINAIDATLILQFVAGLLD